ncbi:MAG: hypothetical protein ACRCZF_22610 [Gemmataceae bacterium]
MPRAITKPVNDVFTGMLVIMAICGVLSVSLLAIELSEYETSTPALPAEFKGPPMSPLPEIGAAGGNAGLVIPFPSDVVGKPAAEPTPAPVASKPAPVAEPVAVPVIPALPVAVPAPAPNGPTPSPLAIPAPQSPVPTVVPPPPPSASPTPSPLMIPRPAAPLLKK